MQGRGNCAKTSRVPVSAELNRGSRTVMGYLLMQCFSACLRAESETGSLLGLSGQPARAEANGALHLVLRPGSSTRVAWNPGILVGVPRDAAATNFAAGVDLETKTRFCRIGLIRPAATHAACERARPSCGLAFGWAHKPIYIKNMLYRLALVLVLHGLTCLKIFSSRS